MKMTGLVISVACAAIICGCAANVPSELVSARLAYEHASAGPAAQLAPADLHNAKQALAQAEKSFSKDADSYETRDLAYVAQRKAEMADAQASIVIEQDRTAQANSDFQTTQGNLLQERTEDLNRVRTALAVSESSGEARAEQLSAEQQARREAEKRTAEQSMLVQEATEDLNQTRTALAVSKRSGEATADQLSAEQRARLEAEKKSAEQSLLAQEKAEDLSQTRAALAVSVRSGEATAEQLSAEQKARLETEKRTAEQLSAEQRSRLEAEKRTAEQLSAEQKARREAEKRTAEQSLLVQEKTQDLNQTRTALEVSQRSGEATAEQLAAEKKARMEAEKRASEAQAALAKLAAIKEDERGMVITLSGSVLFRSDEALLMPGATSRLDQVVDALATTSNRNILVEGFTDSQGSDSYNLELSQRRADTVREYLVHRGYDAGRIRANGVGKGSPIADNSTVEGRANNRRVEIILEREVKK